MHDHSLLIVSSDTSAKGKALNMDAYPGASIRIGIFSCIPWTRCRCNWASEGPGAHGVHARETKLMSCNLYVQAKSTVKVSEKMNLTPSISH